ncbi:hypothetical protein ASG01_01090 [Chryseobacterium sp. Leaf180]|uniref:hypothetical protein n=1 Tax=Chryseobacterium sp. Leaf180 TaxID=1736289 RepID=UPI0006F256A3|nr:hypothetical protein [Chryseobacterium sp. Leaf180]KQR94508.1 hypothetical protein ASG01_01090 [Chryseobacterium sp. Leaf180]
MKIAELFNEICEFKQIEKSENYPDKNIRDLLKLIQEEFKNHFSGVEGQDLKVRIPGYFGHLPNVLYVCILPERQMVSNGIYAAICFDVKGRGALVGCVGSKKISQNIKTVIRKTKNASLKIDVDGASEATKYNNNFVNPAEFFYPLSGENNLIQHLEESLQIAFSLLDEN